jgi:hypothetical protein
MAGLVPAICVLGDAGPRREYPCIVGPDIQEIISSLAAPET